MKAIKAAIYTALGAELAWAWMMGHGFWWHALGFVWAAVFATDIVRFAFPKGGWK